MTALPTPLLEAMAKPLALHVAEAIDGHCVRVDDFSDADATTMANLVLAHLGQAGAADVLVLNGGASQVTSALHVSADRAVELRNRKERPLLLLVPSGTGQAASSLDNSFDRLLAVDLLEEATRALEERLALTPVANPLRRIRTLMRRRLSSEQWARFVAAVADDPTVTNLGRNLWRAAMIPDHGPDGADDRVEANVKAVNALARPPRPVAAATDRLIAAGVVQGPFRARLAAVLDAQAGPLSQPLTWTRMLGEQYATDLTFEQWPLTEMGSEHIAAIKIVPFDLPDGSLNKACKLTPGAAGERRCIVGADKPGVVAVQWSTDPAKTTAVERWRIEVLPPSDLRDQDTAALTTSLVKGDLRRARIQITATDEDLENGSIFVVQITALDASGLELTFEDGSPASAASQDFVVLIDDTTAVNSARRSTADSIPDAVLRLTVAGQEDLQEDVPSWDMDGGVFGLRIGERRLVQIRIAPILVRLQRRALADPSTPVAFRARSPLGLPVDPEDVEALPLALPPTLHDARRRLLAEFAGTPLRDVPEAAAWDPALREKAMDYARKFKRALDAAPPEALPDLLRLETLTLSVSAATGDVTGVVLLPLHPLRLAWIAQHDGVMRDWTTALTQSDQPRNRRSALVDVELASRVTPANLPFCTLDSDGGVAVYAEELTYGAALYLSAGEQEPEAAADALTGALGIRREGASLAAAALLLRQRVRTYREAHPGLAALLILSVNPGAGELLARVARPLVTRDVESDDVASDAAPRLEVVAYSDKLPFSDPLRRLTNMQADLLATPSPNRESHLTPPFGLAARPLARALDDNDGHHLAVLQDLALAESTPQTSPGSSRATSFHDLLTPLVTQRVEDGDRIAWTVGPALTARGSRSASDIVEAHRSHQAALGRTQGGEGMSLVATLDPDQLALLHAVHERADWVITVDRSIGLDFYDDEQLGGLGGGYVLDYAPDFIEGLTQRVTVTTAHRPEVLRVLSDAMTGLGLAAVEGSASQVLDRLQVVSGRLALRLLGDTTLAREAVSLAALITHLETRGKLEGLIVVPVDAHPEIFGVTHRVDDGPARRCDLLLIKVTSRTFSIECVEVKSRKDAALPAQLADHIVEQLNETRELLIDQFFATDPPRIDADLQRSRLAGLLHYYADRAHANHLIADDKIGELHRNIDKLEEAPARPDITMQGYVISLDGAHGFPDEHRGVPIAVLTADDLGRAGFTTSVEVEAHRSQATPPSAAMPPVPTTADPTPDGTASRAPATPHTPTPTLEASTATNRQSPSDNDSGPSPTEERPATRQTVTETSRAAADDNSATAAATTEATGPEPLDVGPTTSPAPTAVEAPKHAGAPPPREPESVRVSIGSDASAASPVELVVSTKGSPHAFILGIPGQGKSVTTRRIIREFAAQGLPSLVFDFHGDMAGSPPAGAQVVDASGGLPFNPFELISDKPAGVKTAAWEISEVIAFVTGMGPIQRTSLFKGLVDAYEACGTNEAGLPARLPTVEEFADAVAARESGKQAQNARERLIPLTDFGLFVDEATGLFDPRRSGMVVDLSQLMEAVQLAGGSFLLRKVYRDMFTWGAGDRLRLAIVLDEAHRLARDVTLPKLMKEGRKYGVAVLVASQNLKDFHKDVVGNAGTKIVFRTNFPESKAVAGFLKGRKGLDLTSEIERLGVGQAYVSTPDHTNARKVLMSAD